MIDYNYAAFTRADDGIARTLFPGDEPSNRFDGPDERQTGTYLHTAKVTVSHMDMVWNAWEKSEWSNTNSDQL